MGDEKYMKLIIQIPCYNEAGTLEIALNDLPRELPGISEIELLIIDDGCEDNTVEVARNWAKKNNVVLHLVRFAKNKGLAKGFMAGLDGCLKNGADIIVNTDADNQYVADDIVKLIQPILDGKADVVIGERPIDDTEHFSWLKKKLQHLGSWVVRKASNTDIPDAPSGFRAFSRDAAMRTNVINDYTYTLETIVQAGRNKMAITSVPIRTNPELRSSRLFKSMGSYIKKSILTILRAWIMYKPLYCFTMVAILPSLIGIIFTLRFIIFYLTGRGAGHTQSLILACTLLIIGFVTFVMGMMADVIASNRKILEENEYLARKIAYSKSDKE